MWQKGDEPEESSRRQAVDEPQVVEFNGKLMLLDQRYPSSARGIVKALEIVFCFLALLLTGITQPTGYSRALPLFFSSLGIVVAFFLLTSYVLALNHRVPSTPWFFMEIFLYVILAFGLFYSAIVMWLFNAGHWADVNPEWAIVPAIASATLFVCTGIFVADLVMLLKNWKRWSWHPHVDPVGEQAERSELPY